MNSLSKRLSATLIGFIVLSTMFSSNILGGENDEIPITTSSKDALSFFLEGRYKFENIQYVAAAALFDEAIETDPNFAMAYLYRARSGGGFNVARQNLENAVKLVDKVSGGEKHFILYFEALNDGDFAKQKTHINKLLELFPSDKRVHYYAGLYNYSIADYKTALNNFTKAKELDKDYAAVYNQIGYAESKLGNYETAENAFKTYIKLIPESPNPYDSYAELLLKTGRYDESIEQYKRAFEKDLTFTSALAGVGHSYIFKKDYLLARKYYQKQFDKTLDINVKLEALMWKTASYLHENRIADALKVMAARAELAVEENLAPDIVQSHFFTGLILVETGNPKEGQKEIDKAIEILQKSNLPKIVKEGLLIEAYLNRCLGFINQNQPGSAEDAAENCSDLADVRNNPLERSNLNATLGMIESKNGNYVKALEYFTLANSEDPFYWYYEADSYEKSGQKDKAESLYKKIKSWNQNSIRFALAMLHLKDK